MTTIIASPTPSPAIPVEWTMADVLRHLGGIPPERIRAVPPLGTATEKDVVESKARFGRICELIDGILVEKTVGYYESLLAATLIHLLRDFVEKHGLGIVLGPDGTLRLLPGQVRIPDVSFLAWERFPDRQLPREPVPALVPDLAIEILSEGNTRGEMERKLQDYFRAGVRLVWCIDPKTRSANVYASPERFATVREDGELDGGEVLPGFRLSLAEFFARAEGGQAK